MDLVSRLEWRLLLRVEKGIVILYEALSALSAVQMIIFIVPEIFLISPFKLWWQEQQRLQGLCSDLTQSQNRCLEKSEYTGKKFCPAKQLF